MELSRTVYLVVWLDTENKIQCKLATPKGSALPDLTGGEVAYKVRLVIEVPHQRIEELNLPPVKIEPLGIRAESVEVIRKE